MKIMMIFLIAIFFSHKVHADIDDWEIIASPHVQDENDWVNVPAKQHQFSLNRWMQALEPFIQDKKLGEIFIPGTHDTATSYISSDSDVNPKCDIGQKLKPLKFLGVHGFIKQWSKAQDLSIAEQLKSGVRYLDIRLAYHPKHKTFWTEHCLFSQPFEDVLLEIKNFIQENPKEIIIIDVQNIDIGDGKIEDIREIIHRKFPRDSEKLAHAGSNNSGNFLTAKDLKKPVKELWAKNKNIVFIVDSDHVLKKNDKPDQYFLDRKTYLESQWYNAEVFKEFAEKSDGYLQAYFANTANSDANKLFVIQAQLTPSTQVFIDFFKNPLKNRASLRDMALSFNQVVVDKFDEWKKLAPGAIIIMDFMDKNYAKMIIDLNFPDKSD